MNVFFFPFFFTLVALGQGLVLVEEAGVALVDVIAPDPGPGGVLVPDPGLATVPVPNLVTVLIPKNGTDLVPTPKIEPEIRASLAVVADQGLLSVPVRGLDLAPVLVVGHAREKETIPII